MSIPVLLEMPEPHIQDYSLILAVNDNFDSLNLLCAVLSDDSFNIVTAENGRTALQMAKETRPDLIISDVVMPGIDGIELCRRLKSDPDTRDIPILLLTAIRYDEAAIVEGLRAGADDYLQTGAPIELLRKKVGNLVAEHKRTEAARLESERHFRLLIENSLDIVTILNADGTIRYESPSVEHVLGYNPLELTGKSAFDLIHPDDAPRVANILNRAAHNENATARMEFRFRHKDGSWRYLEAIGKSLLSEPRVAGVIVNSRDVTDRKQMEAVLRDSEERYKLAMDAVKDHAVFMLDAEGQVVSWNPAAERMMQYQAQEIIGQHCSHFYTTKDSEQGKPQHGLQTAIKEGSFLVEACLRRRDGSLFFASVALTALRDDRGQLKGFLNVVRDITEHHEREEVLRQSKQLLAAILDNSPTLIYIKDRAGRYVVVNRQFENLLQLTNNEIIGKTAFDLFPKEAATAIQANDQEVMDTGSPLELTETILFENKPRHHLSILFPLNDPGGKPYGVCGISTDITAHKSLEEQLRHSQKMEAIGRLAGSVAHDFNNVLTAIIGYSQLLLVSFDKSDPRWPHIQEIEKAGRRAASLTNQLLAFSRKQVLQAQLVDLNSVIENLSPMLKRLIREDVELITSLDMDLARVMADPGYIEQVIMNLAINARDAMPQGGKLTIETGNIRLESDCAGSHMVVPAGDYAMLAVSDSGCGMDAETQARIFDPFFTTKETGKGTGLGLSTVYGIVKQSGGLILVQSEIDRGSTFTVFLPQASTTTGATQKCQAIKPAALGRASATVLLVEDEDAVRKLAQTVLEGSGYTVLEASCAVEALRIANACRDRIDLLLTDVVMPGMDGKALANSIGLARPDVRVLYVSGYTDEDVIQHGLVDHGVAFLEKPFSPETLLDKVQEVLAIAREGDFRRPGSSVQGLQLESAQPARTGGIRD